MEYCDDTAMFMYAQWLSLIAGETLDTDETFIMALTFLSMLSILDEAGNKKIFTICARPGTYPASSFHARRSFNTLPSLHFSFTSFDAFSNPRPQSLYSGSFAM